MNTQPIEKRVSLPTLTVHSIFHTIQGEGPFTGTPAVFIRLAGCNLQCPLCDTDYTSKREILAPISVVDRVGELVRGTRTRLVVITGGEPFRQDLTELLGLLVYQGYFVQIETNGTLPLSLSDHRFHYSRDTTLRTDVFVVCSPKTGSIHQSIAQYACAFKYVMTAGNVNTADGLPLNALWHPAKPYVARPPTGVWSRPVYLQPADEGDEEKNAANLKACVESCMRFGHVLQLQTHKFIGMP